MSVAASAEVRILAREPHLVVAVSGEVDASNVESVAEELALATDTRSRRCFIDLSATTYLDSSGIRVLFTLAQRLRARRTQLELVVPENGMVRRLLEITDVGRIVPLVTSVPCEELPPQH